MANIKNKLIKHSMQGVLSVTAFVSRHESLLSLNNALLRKLAKQRASRVAKETDDIEGLGLVWQKAFPSSKQVPITDITEDTVYAEILTPCPHRGTGNLQACYRMMEYDRAFLREFGGEFTVLESQAAPGVKVCKVAMQLSNAKKSTSLQPAHLSGSSDPCVQNET